MPFEEKYLKEFSDFYKECDIHVLRLWIDEPKIFAAYSKFRSPWTFQNICQSYVELSKSKILARKMEETQIFFTNYVFKTPLLDLCPPDSSSLLEIIDIQSRHFDTSECDEGANLQVINHEIEHLNKFNQLLMISFKEYQQLIRLLPEEKVTYVPQIVSVLESSISGSKAPSYDIIYISTNHPPNVANVQDFYFDCYLPYLKKKGVRFAVAGNVCDSLDIFDHTVSRLGFVQDLAGLYQKSRLVVCPIKYGAGCNMKVLEAMSYGKPVVATSKALESSAGDVSELVIADEPKVFALYILKALSSPARLQGMADCSLEFIRKNHSQEQYDLAMDNVFRDL
jgi:glycosyltransferase involved in cell wall biosynthesis